MAFKFNALTGCLDLVNETSGGSTTYTPATPSDWDPVPGTVGGALDQLAAFDTQIKALNNAQQIYVDSVAGDDTTGTGNVMFPIQTIQHAVTLTTNPALEYVFILAPGTYGGAAVTIPGNVSVVGIQAGITADITMGINSGDEVYPVYSGVDLGNITMDLTLANVALPVFLNASFNITRLDATTGPHVIQIHDGSINDINLTGRALLNNVLFLAAATVQDQGALVLNACTVGINIDVFATGTVSMTGCSFSGSITGTTVLLNTPSVNTDASSLAFGGLITGCNVTYTDTAEYLNFDPTTPSDWTVTPGTIQEALDELAGRVTTIGSKYEQTFIVGDWTGPSGGEYSLTIPEATHLKGINPHIMVFEDVAGFFEEVTVSITIANTGTIELKVLETPDLRFAGKLTII